MLSSNIVSRMWLTVLCACSICLGIMGSTGLSPTLAEEMSSSQESLRDSGLREGLLLARQGAFEQAVVRLREAEGSFARSGQPLKRSEALTALAQVYVALGYPMKAAQSLELALGLVQPSGDQGRMADVMGALGRVYLALGQADAASTYLTEGLDLARQGDDRARAAIILNELGRLHAIQQREKEALQAFGESQGLAEASNLPDLAAAAVLNAGQASLRLARPEEAKQRFDQALPLLRGLPASHHKAYGLITLGLAYAQLGREFPHVGGNFVPLAARVIEEGGDVGQTLGDKRASSYAYGHRGHLYEQVGRYDEALLLTRLAVAAAQQVQAPESLYRWQWQTGRVLKAVGQLDNSITAYERAVEALQAIRSEMILSLSGRAGSFRESGGPLYFELADLLLQRAARAADQKEEQLYLVKARDAVELFKAAELRDYFQDDCVDALQASATKLEDISRRAAVIYPIVLPDRTELLVSLAGGIKRVAVPVTAERLTKEVRSFRRLLEKRTTRQHLRPGRKLYDWLIRPLEADLNALSIDTLVIVPDGPLRTIPFAALHDGKQFLIRRYAVATTPGLNLTDPRPLQRERIKVFAAGLTEGVQGFPPLPYVHTELDRLEELYKSEPLVNQAFITARVQSELKEQEFNIVHIATHAQFKSRVDDTFLLTFDDKLTMDRLSELVGYFRFRNEPLELLTLSACETAAGDDRAALGLAGVALKAGARSALATLWFINDEASSQLVADFYTELRKPSLSKAQALQQAQLKLIDNPRYKHPAYWAPFLLLNNWL